MKTVWLPKDERKVLAHYAKNVGGAGQEYEIGDEDVMKSVHLRKVDDLHNIKRNLHKLKLIVCTNLGRKETDLTVKGRKVIKESENPVIRMTQEGLRLGRKYATLWGTFELWCRENIWFWVILGVLIAIIALVVTIVKD